MWENPSHFPLATWRAITGWGDRLWQELIGIVGWQDVLLQLWIYPLLTVLLALVPLQKLRLNGATRARVAVIAGTDDDMSRQGREARGHLPHVQVVDLDDAGLLGQDLADLVGVEPRRRRFHEHSRRVA